MQIMVLIIKSLADDLQLIPIARCPFRFPHLDRERTSPLLNAYITVDYFLQDTTVNLSSCATYPPPATDRPEKAPCLTQGCRGSYLVPPELFLAVTLWIS
jgi:hypothetical protein